MCAELCVRRDEASTHGNMGHCEMKPQQTHAKSLDPR